MILDWHGSDIAITNNLPVTVLVTLDLRVTHGEDDLQVLIEAIPLSPASMHVSSVPWPDLTLKGVQLDVPGTVSGVAWVSLSESGDFLGGRPINSMSVVLSKEGDKRASVYAQNELIGLVDAALPGLQAQMNDDVMIGIDPLVAVEMAHNPDVK